MIANQNKRVLVSGASIAGPAVAFWLSQNGNSVVVCEQSKRLRDGGQNIDVKESAYEVLSRMGLLEKVKSATVDEAGLKFVDEEDRTIAAFPKGSETSFTQEIEILRGELSRILVEATEPDVQYRFGTTIQSLKQVEEKVQVHFRDGSSDTFDFVVCAEGFGSPTRKLVMSDLIEFNYLGVLMAYFRIPRLKRDGAWAKWFNAVKARVLLMRPANKREESVAVAHWSDEDSVPENDRDQREQLKKVLSGAGWEAERIADNLDYEHDFYYGPITQVKAKKLYKDSFVLVGDAGYCPTPLTGLGTTLALVGAYILAGEIKTHSSLREAFESYEQKMKPYIEKCQKLPPGSPRLVYPKTKIGVNILNSITALIGSSAIQTLLKSVRPKKRAGESSDFVLPAY